MRYIYFQYSTFHVSLIERLVTIKILKQNHYLEFLKLRGSQIRAVSILKYLRSVVKVVKFIKNRKWSLKLCVG